MVFKKKEVIFAACDSIYFMEFGISFIASSLFYNHCTHVHIVNPTAQIKKIVSALNAKNDLFTFSFHNMDFANYDKEAIKTYYACMRFLLIPSLFEIDKDIKLMVLDIDAIIKQTLVFPEQHIGIFLREYHKEVHFKVLASIFYISYKHIDFINTANFIISQYQKTNTMRWYIDQIALYQAYKEKLKLEDIFIFTEDYCGWDSKSGAYVWTAKGARKYKDNLFLKEKKHFENMIKLIKGTSN